MLIARLAPDGDDVLVRTLLLEVLVFVLRVRRVGLQHLEAPPVCRCKQATTDVNNMLSNF